LADKLRALELIGKHLNLFRDRLEVSCAAANPLTLLIQHVQGTALSPVKLVARGEDREQAARRS
jgi:phage terminase small subunit